jgi:hypothetical protein
MWHNNRSVSNTYSSEHSQNAWAIVGGLSGWKKIKPATADGVTNLFIMLCSARANGRNVDVYVVNDMIERVVLH